MFRFLRLSSVSWTSSHRTGWPIAPWTGKSPCNLVWRGPKHSSEAPSPPLSLSFCQSFSIATSGLRGWGDIECSLLNLPDNKTRTEAQGWGAETWKEGRRRNRKGAQGPLQLHTWSTSRPLIQRCLEEDGRKSVVFPPLLQGRSFPSWFWGSVWWSLVLLARTPTTPPAEDLPGHSHGTCEHEPKEWTFFLDDELSHSASRLRSLYNCSFTSSRNRLMDGPRALGAAFCDSAAVYWSVQRAASPTPQRDRVEILCTCAAFPKLLGHLELVPCRQRPKQNFCSLTLVSSSRRVLLFNGP